MCISVQFTAQSLIALTKRGLYEEKPGQTQFLGSLTFLEVPITFARRPEHNVLVAENENDHITLCHIRKCRKP